MLRAIFFFLLTVTHIECGVASALPIDWLKVYLSLNYLAAFACLSAIPSLVLSTALLLACCCFYCCCGCVLCACYFISHSSYAIRRWLSPLFVRLRCLRLRLASVTSIYFLTFSYSVFLISVFVVVVIVSLLLFVALRYFLKQQLKSPIDKKKTNLPDNDNILEHTLDKFIR